MSTILYPDDDNVQKKSSNKSPAEEFLIRLSRYTRDELPLHLELGTKRFNDWYKTICRVRWNDKKSKEDEDREDYKSGNLETEHKERDRLRSRPARILEHDDFMGEVYLTVLELDKTNEMGRFEEELKKRINRKCWSRKERVERKKRKPFSSVEYDIEYEDITPERLLEITDECEMKIKQQTASDKLMEMFWLRVEGGLTHTEMMNRLGIPRRTYWRLHAILQTILHKDRASEPR